MELFIIVLIIVAFIFLYPILDANREMQHNEFKNNSRRVKCKSDLEILPKHKKKLSVTDAAEKDSLKRQNF